MNPKRNRMHTMPLPEVTPAGWLKDQLQIQMDGLTGKLYDVWDSVGSYSGWLGGTGENWERAPYYLDGLLPLAHYLGDKKRWELVCRFVEWTFQSQDEDGNFGPVASKSDFWSRYVMLKVLVQYYEITPDRRVLKLFDRYFHYLQKVLKKVELAEWSKARVGDLLYCINWYYERQPDSYILELVDTLRLQALDWVDVLENFPFVKPCAYYYDWKGVVENHPAERRDSTMRFHTNHIVNVTMGMKYPAMLSYFYQDKDFDKISKQGMESAEKYHGVASGAVNGDEHLSGNSPSQGAELCSIVEYMFSLQTMLEAFGDPYYAELLEKLAYNALPATISEDFMAHQYLQQANQVLVSNGERNWFNNRDDSNVFGLEPNFGCCTANMHQGWPKLLKSLWYRDADALVSMVFAPCVLATMVQGKPFTVAEETEYPFKNVIKYKVTQADGVMTKLKIRLPRWCGSFELLLNGNAAKAETEGGFLTLERVWNTGDVVTFTPAMEQKKSNWFHDSIAVERGPLVYALDIKEKWNVIKEVAGIKDYEILPESPWNYAVAKDGTFAVQERPVSKVPFSKQQAPVVLRGKGKRIPDWRIEDNSAGVLPPSPVKTDSAEEEITLLPYGCTKLRILQFPYYSN